MAMGKMKMDEATKIQCLAEAERFLNIAVRAETEGKSEKMIDMGLAQAVKWEDAAFDSRL